MLYIRIELWPRGNRERARVIGEAIVWNKGGTAQRGEYGYAMSKRGGFKGNSRPQAADVRNVLHRGEVTGFPRLRLLAWDLLGRVLRDARGDRS